MTDQAQVKELLVEAVRSGELEDVTELVNCHGLSYCPDLLEGYILLCEAIQHRWCEVAKFLLEKGTKVNGESDSTPLHLAIEEEFEGIVELLLKHGAEVNRPRVRDGYTPLHIACERRCDEIITALLNCKADCNAKADDDSTPLHIIGEVGNCETIESLLNFGAQVNCSRLPDKYTPFHIVCEKGWVESFDVLLKRGADPFAKAYDGSTSLHIVTQKGYFESIESLLHLGAQINDSRHSDNYTPLHIACDVGHPDIVEYLLTNGADPNLRANDNITALHVAAQRCRSGDVIDSLLHHVAAQRCRSVEVIDSLLRHGADVNCARLSDNYTALHIACAQENPSIEVISALLNSGASPNMRANNNITPLHIAAKTWHLNIVETLLNHGAKVNCARYDDGFTPLFIACQKNFVGIVEFLLNSGADPYVRSSKYFDMTPLHLAVQAGNFQTVECLLKYKLLLNAQTLQITPGYGLPGYCTPLHLACAKASVGSIYFEIAVVLLKNGADPNVEAEDDITPLLLAANNLEMVKTLLEHGADVTCARSSDNFTPLHIACEKGSKTVDVLLDIGVDPNVRTKDGLTPLHMVCMSSYCMENLVSAVESLLKHGAEINCVRPGDNYTPLHLACHKSTTLVVRVLLDGGADPNLRAKDGTTPLHLAVKCWDRAILKLLLSNSADINVETHEGLSPVDLALKQDEDKYIIDFFKIHVIALKAAGLHVSEKILHQLDLNESRFHDFKEKCANEVEQMKSIEFSGYFTLYDVLKGQWKPAYARNESLMETLMSFNHEEFPVYFHYFKKSKERMQLLISGQKWLDILMKTSNVLNGTLNLPVESQVQIVSYLKNADLENLNVCGENLKRQFFQ